MKKSSIRTRLVLLLTICLTVMVTIITIVSLRMYESKLEAIYQENTAEKIELLNMYIDNYLETPIALVENTAKDITALNDANQLHEDLLLRANSIKETLGLHIAFEGDPYLYSSGEIMTDADYNSNERAWYKDSMAAPAKVIITDPYPDALTNEKIISVSKALANGQGVVVLDLKLSFLDDIVSKVTIGQAGYSFVLDNAGNILYHPNYSRNESLVDHTLYDVFMKNAIVETTLNGEKTFLTRHHNEKMNWQIGSLFTSKELDAIYKPLVLPSILVNTVCVLILAIVFFFLLTRVLRPLKTLNAVAQEIAQGDLTQQVKVTSHDEIGQLSANFNEMTAGLKSMIVQVDATSAKLTSFSSDVSASVEENVQSISQVVQNIHNVTDQTQEQLQAATNVNESIQSIGDEVTIISSNMQDVHLASSTAEHQTTAGVQSMDHVMKQMTSIETNTKETTENFNTLVSVASEIDTFSKAISGIAGQTNLLALNASIEAARAGEHGKGFAVVAEEVRKLAEQTNEAASEIQALVSTIQRTGDIAKASIASNNAAVQAGLTQIDETAQVFHSIHDTMASLAEKINTTQAAIDVLQTRKNEALASAEEITHASRTVSNHVEQVAATTEEQNASMEQMAVSAEQLAKQAQELQQTIQRFTY